MMNATPRRALARVSLATKVSVAGVLMCALLVAPWGAPAAQAVSLKPNCPPSQGCDPHWGWTPGYGNLRVVYVNIGNMPPGPMINAFINLINAWNAPWYAANKDPNWPLPVLGTFSQATSSCQNEGNYTINICGGTLASNERGLTSWATFSGTNLMAWATVEVDSSMMNAPTSFQNAVACHELGHAIWGLGHDPQTATGTCMTPAIGVNTPNAYNASDKATINALYVRGRN
jgi:hypothetical protein